MCIYVRQWRWHPADLDLVIGVFVRAPYSRPNVQCLCLLRSVSAVSEKWYIQDFQIWMRSEYVVL